MTIVLRFLSIISFMALLLACGTRQPDAIQTNVSASTPTPMFDQIVRAWPNAPYEHMWNNEPLKRAWQDFERTQKYRLAQPSDRKLAPAAAARVKSNAAHQIIPVINWWGARGYRGANTKDFLVAIVVDPSRSDPNRYGLVVIAAVASEGKDYKPYWVLREDDMESYLLSPASGSVYIECFRRGGAEETKELIWDRKTRRFSLD